MKNKTVPAGSTTESHDFFSALKNLEHKVEDIFHNMIKRSPSEREAPQNSFYDSFIDIPKIDVIDKDQEILVKAELPGIDKDDLDISVSSNQLVIKAKTMHESKEEDGDYVKREISRNEIYRSVLLPSDVDDSKVKSKFKNGVLSLTLPKHEGSQRRKIKVD